MNKQPKEMREALLAILTEQGLRDEKHLATLEAVVHQWLGRMKSSEPVLEKAAFPDTITELRQSKQEEVNSTRAIGRYAAGVPTERIMVNPDHTVVVGAVDEQQADEGLQAAADVARLTERYRDQGLLGVGGMGEIRRMYDRALNRVVAMKLLKAKHQEDPLLVERFLEEAQVTAQLEHPGIIPTHDVGRWIDGRLFFTMREIKGQTLAQVLEVLHPSRQGKTWRSASPGGSLRRLLTIFVRTCEAVGYAHDRGVIHRDLKPANIIVGTHGDVQVVDWGLVKRMEPRVAALPEGKVPSVTRSKKEKANPGILLGTPRYMAPEQILHPEEVDERCDVYALGILLYEILSGYPPYRGQTVRDVLVEKLQGYPQPPGLIERSLQELPPWRPWPEQTEVEAQHLLPLELLEICATAMAPEVQERYPHAGALAQVMEDWLDGLQKKRRAMEVVKRAHEQATKAEALREEALERRHEADLLAQDIEGWEPEEDKWQMWTLEEQALELEQRSQELYIESIQLLQGALTHEPELQEAHLALAENYHKEHKEAEAQKDRGKLMQTEAKLRYHVESLRPHHPRRLEFDKYLQGDGEFSVVTAPARAEAQLLYFEKRGRRLVEVEGFFLGNTPLLRQSLPKGSYVLKIQAEGHLEVRYPIYLRRGFHWTGVPPEQTEALPIVLPPVGSLHADECFVPRGWFLSGGDPEIHQMPRWIWVDDFIIQRFPVTNREYLAFLNALVEQGRERDALIHVPRERAGTRHDQGAMIYGRDTNGLFVLQTDADGDTWQPDWPVIMIDWHGAVAYARWLRSRTGLPWRLPWEVEWEKAARGVDGRYFPWGDEFDPSWACMRKCRKDKAMIADVIEFPVDKSVYGVRGMAGNVGDWCLDIYTKTPLATEARFVPPKKQVVPKGAYRVLRGGNWSSEMHSVRLSFRTGFRESMRHSGGGIRLVRPYSLG